MLKYPEKCLRNKTTCQPYGQLESCEDAEGNKSFFCCGKNDGTEPPVEEDRYTLCFKGEFRDTVSFNDRRDLIDQMHVIAYAMSHIELDYLEEQSK
jgi:hypothetical protein